MFDTRRVGRVLAAFMCLCFVRWFVYFSQDISKASAARIAKRDTDMVQYELIRSLLRTGVQPTLDPVAETFMSVQCASPGRGGEIVGVFGVCARCVGWRKA